MTLNPAIRRLLRHAPVDVRGWAEANPGAANARYAVALSRRDALPRRSTPHLPLPAISLCSGIGGLDLGLVQSGLVRVVLAAEHDAFAVGIYESRFPGVPVIREVEEVPDVVLEASATVVFAGWPCQPHSQAGLRRQHADERELWPAVRDVIASARPTLFVGENVPAIMDSRGHDYFLGVAQSLLDLGYAVEWAHVPAGGLGAPHRRDRVFIVARRDGRWALADEPTGERVAVSGFGAWPRCGRMERRHRGEVQPARDRFPPRDLPSPQWGTLRASEFKGVGPLGSRSHQYRLARHYLDAQVQEFVGETGRLTIPWLEWFMGFPRRWTWPSKPRRGVDPLPWLGWNSSGPPLMLEPIKRSEGDWQAVIRALGNAVCPPVARWVGERIVASLR